MSNPSAATTARTAGQTIQHGVTAVCGLLIVGIIVVSVVLARSIPDGVDKSGAAVGVTALLLFFAAGAVGSGLGFLFGREEGARTERGRATAVGTSLIQLSGAVAAPE